MRIHSRWFLAIYSCTLLCCSTGFSQTSGVGAPRTVRFATFNVSFYGKSANALALRVKQANDSKLAAVAEIIQRVRPDVLLLNEVDYDASGALIDDFQKNYLAQGQNGSQSSDGPAEPIDFPFRFLAPSNTGIHSGADLDRNGRVTSSPGSRDYGGDCWGYGEYPGKYAMVLLSRYPIDSPSVRTFRKFRWKDMPEALLPDDPATSVAADWYSQAVLNRFPLSSKSHWDVPINVAGRTIHLLASHPTPPTFDGQEDRNGRRNHDEIRFWVDYLTPGAGDYLYDDQGGKGGLPLSEDFVLMGDLNGDPCDGQAVEGIGKLLASARISTEPVPGSDGGSQQAGVQGESNAQHRGNPRFDTLDARDRGGPGNLRVDYVLPARGLKVAAAGVFWPHESDRYFSLVGTHPFPSSDHRLVWLDVELDSIRP